MNRQIRRLALGLIACYAILFLQLNVWQVVRSDELKDDSRNNRELLRDFNSPRGRIITADDVVVAETIERDLDGNVVRQRTYPERDLFANVTGYFTLGFGSSQLERSENDVLAGRTAEQQLQLAQNLFADQDVSGDVILAMREDIQTAAKEALGDREGSIVVLDVRTGAVLAMWSWPTFDPNILSDRTRTDTLDWFNFLNADNRKPLLANAYQERYMPGSTFKVITTATALRNSLIDLTTVWEDESAFTPPQTTDPIENYGGSTCGGDLTEVFTRSCNIPFARIALTLGAKKLVGATDDWGFGENIPLDLPRSVASVFGTVNDFEDDLPMLAIQGFGQGNAQMVPLHMAMVAATIANGGKMMVPYVVSSTVDRNGKVLTSTSPTVWRTPIDAETAAILTELMIGVVRNGTASCCMQLANGAQAAAKTGTAQLNAKGEPMRSHAWITAFAPANAPKVAIAVMVKGVNDEVSASTGGRLAGPIAKRVLDVALKVLGP